MQVRCDCTYLVSFCKVFAEDGKWKALPIAEYRSLAGPHCRVPGAGVLELFAQPIEVSWESSDATLNKYELMVQTIYLENTKASTIHAAFETAFPELDLQHLHRLSIKLRFFIVSEVPDNISANFLKKKFYSPLLPHNCLYSALTGCDAHRLHRVIIDAIEEATLCGVVHAT